MSGPGGDGMGDAVWRLPLMADGAPSKVGCFLQLSGGTGPDGIAVLASGGLAVCHVGLGAVWLFGPTGEPEWRVDSCAGPGTTNLAFGGADRRTLYVTESETGQILRADIPVAGLALYSHA